MKFKISAVNTKNGEKLDYELEGDSVQTFKYYD